MRGLHDLVEGRGTRHHLFLGPRSMGKTHLVSVVAHRAEAATELTGRLAVAWLNEDPWRIRDYATFVASVAAAMVGKQVRATTEVTGADVVERELLGSLGDRALLIVVENLQEVFDRLGVEGQHRLRAFCENHRRTAIVATSTARFGVVTEIRRRSSVSSTSTTSTS